VFFVRAGAKKVECAKGRSGIAGPSIIKLAGVIVTVIAAVRAAELDDQIKAAARKL
jgi:hypothetical protein